MPPDLEQILREAQGQLGSLSRETWSERLDRRRVGILWVLVCLNSAFAVGNAIFLAALAARIGAWP